MPPVNKNDDNLLLANPHIFLDEIMRQAAESEIIQLSMKIRNNEPIGFSKGQEVQVIKMSELNTGMLQWADQVICATNKTRVSLNNQMRELMGRGPDPEDGDKIICLRNYWNKFSSNGDALVNGTIGYLQDSYESFVRIPFFLQQPDCPISIRTVNGNFISDTDEHFNSLNMDRKMILEGEAGMPWKLAMSLNSKPKYKHLIPMEFTYGYAITGHKSQGSEWDKVVVIEERFPFSHEEHKRWLYTCCTRAAQKLVLVRPD